MHRYQRSFEKETSVQSVLPKSPEALQFPLNLHGSQELGAAYFTTAIVRAGREDWREVTMGPTHWW